MTIADSRVIELSTISDDRGKLTFVEGDDHVPFEIRRVYYIYDVPQAVKRGAHAHRALRQVMIAMSGSFDVVLNDGKVQRRFNLDRPDRGLFIPSMLWRSLENFSTDAICCVLASAPHQESDYIRNYDDFLHAVRVR